jgi:hypothetical protein
VTYLSERLGISSIVFFFSLLPWGQGRLTKYWMIVVVVEKV